jgi:hypothetical protein
LLHHCEPSELTSIATAEDAENKLRKILGEYNKVNLHGKHYPWNSVLLAIQRAKNWDLKVKNNDSPEMNTTQIYRLLERILDMRTAREKGEEC